MASQAPTSAVSVPELRCAIASPHGGATAAGVAAVRQGGNAVDAAIAVAVALTVAYPHNTSLGGDLFALVRQPDGTVRAVNASGPAAAGVDVGAVRARHGGRMPVRGVDTVTVPGAVAGLASVQGLGAALDWAALIAPSEAMAHDGVPVTRSVGRAIASERSLVLADEGLSSVLAPGGRLLRTGDRLVQPRLARTLGRLAEAGPDEFYRGSVGHQLLQGLAAAGSALDQADFSRFGPTLEEPLRRTAMGLEVATAGPNSQGFVLLAVLQALELLGVDDPLGDGAGVLAAIICEGAAVRDRRLADPRCMERSVDDLLDPEHWRSRLERLADRPSEAAHGPRRGGDDAGAGRPADPPGGDTVAVVTADTDGRAVSLIQSLYHSFGAGILEPSTGLIVHDRGALFSLDPGSPNVLAPGKRPAHTLMPVLVHSGGSLRLVAGTRGGKAQPQIHTQLLLHTLAGDRPDKALARPRWMVETEGPKPVVAMEPGVGGRARRAIEARMDVSELGELDEATGHAHLIAVRGALLDPACDPRSDGAAEVVSRP